jgi:hypothetical protein
MSVVDRRHLRAGKDSRLCYVVKRNFYFERITTSQPIMYRVRCEYGSAYVFALCLFGEASVWCWSPPE